MRVDFRDRGGGERGVGGGRGGGESRVFSTVLESIVNATKTKMLLIHMAVNLYLRVDKKIRQHLLFC